MVEGSLEARWGHMIMRVALRCCLKDAARRRYALKMKKRLRGPKVEPGERRQDREDFFRPLYRTGCDFGNSGGGIVKFLVFGSLSDQRSKRYPHYWHL